MHELDPDAFAGRAPTAKKTHRVELGQHHCSSGDGHNKLNQNMFPVSAIRDHTPACMSCDGAFPFGPGDPCTKCRKINSAGSDLEKQAVLVGGTNFAE
jgi:hypothetical protein